MMLRVRFFGALRERLGCTELAVEVALAPDLDTLLQHLSARSPQWQQALLQPGMMRAVNKTLVHDNTALNENDEVAFFPPVTGG